MIEIIPAILPKSLQELREGLLRLRGISSWAQVDLVGTNILTGEEAMPFWEEYDFEFDIMLADPAREIEGCLALGASRLVVHAAAHTAPQAIEMLQPMRGGDYSIEVGIALRAHDAPGVLAPFATQYDFVQVMGIEHEGRQGEPFDERALFLVAALRALYPELPIQVDGGVKLEDVRALARAGANRLVVGSAIFGTSDAAAAYKALYTEANAE